MKGCHYTIIIIIVMPRSVYRFGKSLIAMWTILKHVSYWDPPAGLVGARLGLKTPLPIHEEASQHTTCTPLVPSYQVGDHPVGGKDFITHS